MALIGSGDSVIIIKVVGTGTFQRECPLTRRVEPREKSKMPVPCRDARGGFLFLQESLFYGTKALQAGGDGWVESLKSQVKSR